MFNFRFITVLENFTVKVAYTLLKLLSGRMDKATEAVDSGSILGRVKPKTKKLVFTAPLLNVSN